MVERLPDGSWLSTLHEVVNYKRHREGMPVRVIEYTIEDPGRPQAGQRYRLLTTVPDPAAAPQPSWPPSTASAGSSRRSCTSSRPTSAVRAWCCASQTPDGVRQEVWACLCVHYAIRWLMHTVALEADTDPDRLSFTRTLQAVRRSTASHPGSSP